MRYSPEQSGTGTQINLVGEDPLPLGDYERTMMLPGLVQFAEQAKANPEQSDYQVKAVGETVYGQRVVGANQENSLSDAFAHGETSVESQKLTLYGRETHLAAIAFYNESVKPEELVISPCGACRDVLNHYEKPDLIIAGGNLAVIGAARLKDFQKEDFEEIDPSGVGLMGIAEATEAMRFGVDEYLPEHLKLSKNYGAVLLGANGDSWRGGLYTNAGYDAVTPVMAAVINWHNTVGDPDHQVVDLNKVVITSRGDINSVLYRDRQALLELDEVLQAYTGREEPLTVELVAVAPESERVIKAVRTNTREWMPYPFSAGSFGMDDVIRQRVAKLGQLSQFEHKH